MKQGKGIRILLYCMILSLLLTACQADTAVTSSTSNASVPKETTAELAQEDKTSAVAEKAEDGYVVLTLTSDRHHASETDGWPMWGEDEISKTITDMTGVSLKVVYDETNNLDPDHSKALKTMLASGEYTDLVYIRHKEEINMLSDPQYSMALDALAEEYCPTFWDDLDPLVKLNNTAADGHVYTLLKGYNDQDVYANDQLPVNVPQKLILRKDILEKLGQEQPTSVEDLEAYFYLAKSHLQQLPAVQALIDSGEATSTTATSVLVQMNVTASPIAEWMGVKRFNFWDAEAGRVRMQLNQEAWLPYIQMMNRWYCDGILTLPEKLTWQDNDGFSVGDFYSSHKGYTVALAAGERRTINSDRLYVFRDSDSEKPESFPYILVENPLTYEGDIRLTAADTEICNWDDARFAALFISSHCRYPEKTIEFVDFLKSEDGAQLTHWGIEGTHYTKTDDGYIVYKDEYKAKTNWVHTLMRFSGHRQYGLGYWNMVDRGEVTRILDASPVSYYTNSDFIALREMEVRAGVNYKKYAQENKNPVLYFAEPQAGDEDYDLYYQLQETWNTAVWEMVTDCPVQQVEDRWDALMKELETMGLNHMEESMTARYTAALKRYQDAGYFTNMGQ